MHLAVTREHASIEVEHWMSILVARGGPFEPLLRTLDIAADRVADDMALRLDRMRGNHHSAPSFSRPVLEWLEEGWLAASLRFGRNEVLATDLLLALTTSAVLERLVREIAPSLRLDDAKVMAIATSASRAPSPAPAGTVAGATPQEGAAPRGAKADSDIARFTVDLTAAAREGKLDPVVGREAELRQVVDILMRRRQNNPILTGEAGVGKTAVVEALALRIAAGDVPPMLADVTILALDLGLLQAGAGVKGEFERRLTGLIAEIKAATTPIILFIDEAHLMIGAGNQSGGSDAANLLKPPLARGELRTIAATTWSEYKRHIERDPALTRRFQVVKVDEPKPELAVRMLRGIVPSLETHHGVRIKDEALVEAVRLSARHLPDRQLPDKAISVLDTAAAGVAISHATDPAAIEDLVAETAHLATERAAIVRDEGVDMASALAAIDARIADVETQLEALRARVKKERLLVEEIAETASAPEGGEDEAAKTSRLERRRKLEEKLAALQGEAPLVHPRVDKDAVAAVVARWTGVPVGRLVRDAVVTARTLEDRLRQRVVGQDRALAVIASAMRTSAARLGDPRKPPGVFLMVGTSGVGKTETALALADQLFGGSQHLSIINMSEFKEEHKVSSLVGAPPGYVGYGEGGVLTEAVRRRPYGLLLMDEVEKAHPGVQDVFYQVFDKGMLRDGEGRDIEFLNTTIILTSNAGSETLASLAADPETLPEGDALVEALQPELAKVFKPAFLGRVTIVPYLPLSEPVLHDIFKLQVARIAERLALAYGAQLVVAPGVEDAIVARCLAGSIGARAIEGVLSREVLPAISDVVLAHALGDGAAIAEIHVDLDDARRISVRATLSHGTASVPSEQAAVRPADCDHQGDQSRSGGLTPEPVDLAQA
ncbi:MAG: type VI secretion system ATPase TssH [Beijerinckiaceae bacterium]|nr:type VI secretion system ATPase TssH [Beijerinckiaceae bacterium]